ncbi:MAG: SigB/SigF/SigG family RNA polymerase sigma factor [Solirubrobacteraceae bacterium]
MSTVAIPNQVELFERWQDCGDRAARDQLVARFLPLARSLARRYDRSSEPFDDLLQVASLGLVKAIDRFDTSRGHAFASYAVPTILGELKRYFRDSGWSVHVPRGAQERALKVEEARLVLTAEKGRAPTVPELAQYLELDFEAVLAALQAAQAYDALSLDAPRPSSDGDSESYGESLGMDDARLAIVDDGVTVAGAIARLSERERRVLHLRFAEDLTQTEIAQRVGVSQMQVSRLLRRSLTQLREMVDGEDGAETTPLAA